MQQRNSIFGHAGGAYFCAVAAIALLAMTATSAQAQDAAASDLRLTGTIGFDYTNGSYGTARNTNVLLQLTSLSLETGNFRFNASLPYMQISGRGLVVFDAAGNPIVINRRTNLPPDLRVGFGDVNLSGTYTIPPAILGDFELKLTGSVKLPTASVRRRLSTGEADFGLSFDLSRQFGDWAPFVTVGYLLPGQSAAYTLDNTTSVSVGTSLTLSDKLVAVVSYDFDTATTPLVPASHEVFTSLSWIFSNRITLTGYGTAGLGLGAPDAGFGLLVSYGFN